jgi:glucose uptake protein GlcU
MQKPYISLYGQLVYVLIAGSLLLFIPNLLLPLFGFTPTSDIWIRVMGLLVLALSFYYYAMARHGSKIVVRSTVQGRLFFCAGLVVFVLLGLAKPALMGFALAETGLAVWTFRELRQR